jgi:hypothetical protein
MKGENKDGIKKRKIQNKEERKGWNDEALRREQLNYLTIGNKIEK